MRYLPRLGACESFSNAPLVYAARVVGCDDRKVCAVIAAGDAGGPSKQSLRGRAAQEMSVPTVHTTTEPSIYTIRY